jgi:hypothetical protein
VLRRECLCEASSWAGTCLSQRWKTVERGASLRSTGTRCTLALSRGFLGAVGLVLLAVAGSYIPPPGPGNRQGGEGDDVEGERSYTVLIAPLVWIASPEKR